MGFLVVRMMKNDSQQRTCLSWLEDGIASFFLTDEDSISEPDYQLKSVEYVPMDFLCDYSVDLDQIETVRREKDSLLKLVNRYKNDSTVTVDERAAVVFVDTNPYDVPDVCYSTAYDEIQTMNRLFDVPDFHLGGTCFSYVPLDF